MAPPAPTTPLRAKLDASSDELSGQLVEAPLQARLDTEDVVLVARMIPQTGLEARLNTDQGLRARIEVSADG